jgi:hypothetical protein
VSRPWHLVVALSALTALASCTVPVPTARSAADYEKKARHTAEAVHSPVETVLLALDGASRDRIFSTSLGVVVGEAEDEAAGAAKTFTAEQPPDDRRSDALRRQLMPLLDAARTDLAATRIDVNRGDRAAMLRHQRGLQDLARQLDDFANGGGG